jgi:phosphonate transport system permease protein
MAASLGPGGAADRDALLRPWPRVRARTVLTVLGVVAIYAWGIAGTDVRPADLVAGLPSVADFISRLTPPVWTMTDVTIPALGVTFATPEVLLAIIETIQMAIVGTSVAVVAALPLGLLAARNTSPHRAVYQATRFVLNTIRSIPDLIIALMFVAAVGLGPFGGVLALSVAALGSMGKLYAEAIEAIDPQQALAVKATGATRLQTFAYGVVPQALPLVASYSLLLFETNVRSATVLGIVGAGGVGFLLANYMALFQYRNLLGALILIVIAVTCLDRLSDAIRKRLT